ncbi:hypothetical protein INT45_012844 [Circinella minor]|uniref:No apical meristem-associated C-terminal domain-containing protein n=1 Tax=Circinella minor TaxID=1195481 RepID=A0A8H7VJ70_9FUNG|nr:hypothetical protein INT45_012844 [Circinella minor]
MSSNKIVSQEPDFLPHEDKQLCSSWLIKTECPIRGSEKNDLTHWKRITEHYNSERQNAVKKLNEKMGRDDQPVIRTHTSLKMRWDTIHPLVSTFCGHYQRVLNDKQSGFTPEKIVTVAKLIYHELEGHEFPYYDCWKEVLSRSQIWKVVKEEKKKKVAKAENAVKRKVSYDVVDDNELSSKRLIGVKKAKKEEAYSRMLKKEREMDLELFEKQSQSNLEQRLQLMRECRAMKMERLDREWELFYIEREQHDKEVLEKDLTGLNDDARTYYEYLREEILQRMKENISKASGANTKVNPLLSSRTDGSKATEEEIN